MSYTFELLIIDANGQTSITKANSLVYGLLFAENIWNKAIYKENPDNTHEINDTEQDINLKIQAVDTSSALNDLIESAFLIRVKSDAFDNLESFRYKLLVHITKSLNFRHIRILRDDISTDIANKIYPKINKVENLLRRYLVKFFIQKIGVNWWDVTAPKSLADKINSRKNNEKVFSQLVETDVTLIDFDDLGELIYKQTSGFNRQESIISKVMNAKDLDDLNILKQELQSNYTKYFKEAFQDKQFEKKWKLLFEIRNKVAHNNLFVKIDLENANEICSSLESIIDDAESKINEFKFSVEEQQLIRQATIEAVKEAESQSESKEKMLEKLGVKVLGKIELPDNFFEEDSNDDDSQYKIISEEQLISELQRAESTLAKNNLTFVGLRAFVTKILEPKGYAIGPTYSLINILKDKDILDIYEVEDGFNGAYPTKAIRLKN